MALILATTTIRPGFLVSLKTTVSGNVLYSKRDLEVDRPTETGERVAKWETERTILAPAEHEAAGKARGLARTAVTRLCAISTFGLLCPQDRQAELAAAITEARRIADEFNQTAMVSRLHVGVIVGRVAQDDAEAVRAINSEVRQLLDDMTAGIQKLDVEAVRDAASKAKSLGQMLAPGAADAVQKAISVARDVAKRMVKAGDQAAQAVDQATLNTIANARTAFLDLDEPVAVVTTASVEGRALDLDTAPAVAAVG